MCGRMVAFLIERPGGGVAAGPPCVGALMRDYRCGGGRQMLRRRCVLRGPFNSPQQIAL